MKLILDPKVMMALKSDAFLICEELAEMAPELLPEAESREAALTLMHYGPYWELHNELCGKPDETSWIADQVRKVGPSRYRAHLSRRRREYMTAISEDRYSEIPKLRQRVKWLERYEWAAMVAQLWTRRTECG